MELAGDRHQPDPLQSGGGRCACAPGVPSRGGQRSERVPGRRRRYGRQHGVDAQGGARRARSPAGRQCRAHDRRDRPRGDRAVGRARGAAGREGQLGRDPLPADQGRRRGACQPPRPADRRDADRGGACQRRRPCLCVGARAGRGHDPDGRARDGPRHHGRPRPRRGRGAAGPGDRAARAGSGDRKDARTRC